MTPKSRCASNTVACNLTVQTYKAGFHMIVDDRGSQKVLRSSAIIWKHTSAIACDRDRRRSQKIEPCSIGWFPYDRKRSRIVDRRRSQRELFPYNRRRSQTIAEPTVAIHFVQRKCQMHNVLARCARGKIKANNMAVSHRFVVPVLSVPPNTGH